MSHQSLSHKDKKLETNRASLQNTLHTPSKRAVNFQFEVGETLNFQPGLGGSDLWIRLVSGQLLTIENCPKWGQESNQSIFIKSKHPVE